MFTFKVSSWTNPAALLIPTVRGWLFKRGIAALKHFGNLEIFHKVRVNTTGNLSVNNTCDINPGYVWGCVLGKEPLYGSYTVNLGTNRQLNRVTIEIMYTWNFCISLSISSISQVDPLYQSSPPFPRLCRAARLMGLRQLQRPRGNARRCEAVHQAVVKLQGEEPPQPPGFGTENEQVTSI